MRITNSTLSTNYMRNLTRNLEQMQKYQNQLSSGKEVSKPSENPLLVSKIMDLSNNILQNEQYNTNISDSIGWVRTQDGALNNVNGTLNRIRDLMIYGSNGSLSDTDRLALSDELGMKVQELADTLNTNFDGRYIFSGQKTLTMPFSMTGPDNDTLTYITDPGADKNLTREISKGVTVELLTAGGDIITTSGTSESGANNNLGDLLSNVLAALKVGGDTTKLGGDYLADIDKHIDNVLQFRSKIGAIDNRLEAAEARNVSENLNLNTILSKREDIDIAEKYMEFSVMKSVYQASLAVGGQILQPSLLDYIRWKGMKQMNIETKYLGEIELSEENIIEFPNGLLGFESSKEFVLLDVPENTYFKFLQDIHNSYISFLLLNPWDFFKDYDVELSDEELEKIGISHNEKSHMSIYSVVTLGQEFKSSTTNLLAPIVINFDINKGRQFILNDSIYTTKHKLFPEGKVDWNVGTK